MNDVIGLNEETCCVKVEVTIFIIVDQLMSTSTMWTITAITIRMDVLVFTIGKTMFTIKSRNCTLHITKVY